MHERVVIAPSRSSRITWIAIPALVPILLLAVIIVLELADGASIGELLREADEILLFASIPILLMILLLGYIGLVNIRLRLILDAEHIYYEGIPHPMILRKPTAYEDVIEVNRGLDRSILLLTRAGKTIRINPGFFNTDHLEILAELRKRIPADRFEPDIESTLTSKTPNDRRQAAYFLLILVFLLAGLVVNPWIKARRGKVWTTAARPGKREDLVSFVVDAYGSGWLLLKSRDGPFLDPSSYGIRQIESQTNQWIPLPTSDELFTHRTDKEFPLLPNDILLTAEGMPLVMFHNGKPLLGWTGAAWEWQEDDVQTVSAGRKQAGGRFHHVHWRPWPAEEAIITFDAVNKQTTQLPPEMLQNASWITGESLQTSQQIHLLSLPGKQPLAGASPRQQTPERWIVIPWSPAAGNALLADIVMEVTRDGRLFLVQKKSPYCSAGWAQYLTVRYDPSQEQLTAGQIAHRQDCEEDTRLGNILIDDLNRLWLQHGDAISVFPEGAFSSGADPVGSIRTYNRHTSNYEGSDVIMVQPDGKLWVLDRYRGGLACMDTGQDPLPKPLPRWIEGYDRSLLAPVIFNLLPSLALLFGVFHFRRIDSRPRRATPGNRSGRNDEME